MELNRIYPPSAKNNEVMVSNIKLLAVWSEWRNFKGAMIAHMQRKMHWAKRANRQRFEKATQTEVVREGFLEEGTSQPEPEN